MTTSSGKLLQDIRDNALALHEECAALLGKKGPIPSRDVHALRVASKRLRAHWQLLKPLLKDRTADDANRTLRDAARTLRSARDLHAMASTLASLAEHAHCQDARDILTRGHQLLFGDNPPTATNGKRSKALTEAFATDRQRWQQLALKIPDSRLHKRGYHRLYEKAWKLARAAQESGDVTLWHRNRKWVKYLGYNLALLHSTDDFAVAQSDVAGLGTMLGELHDIHCLIGHVEREKARFASEDDAAYLVHQLRTEESHLQWRCEKAARKILRLSPKQFENALTQG